MEQLINNQYNSFELFREDYGNLCAKRINALKTQVKCFEMYGKEPKKSTKQYFDKMRESIELRITNFETIIKLSYKAYKYSEITGVVYMLWFCIMKYFLFSEVEPSQK